MVYQRSNAIEFESADGKYCNGQFCPMDGTLLIMLADDRVCVTCGEIFHPVKKQEDEDTG